MRPAKPSRLSPRRCCAYATSTARLTADVDRLAESLDNLGEPAPGHRPSVDPDEMVLIPDDPYDESMWQDAQSETQHAQ